MAYRRSQHGIMVYRRNQQRHHSLQKKSTRHHEVQSMGRQLEKHRRMWNFTTILASLTRLESNGEQMNVSIAKNIADCQETVSMIATSRNGCALY